jgi:hypothetical protein
MLLRFAGAFRRTELVGLEHHGSHVQQGRPDGHPSRIRSSAFHSGTAKCFRSDANIKIVLSSQVTSTSIRDFNRRSSGSKEIVTSPGSCPTTKPSASLNKATVTLARRCCRCATAHNTILPSTQTQGDHLGGVGRNCCINSSVSVCNTCALRRTREAHSDLHRRDREET